MQDTNIFDDPKLRMILDKVIALFTEFGIRNLNMDDISKHLKISKKTLYQYVKSKEDLIETLFFYDNLKWDNQISKIKIDELNAIDFFFEVSLLVSVEMDKIDSKSMFELRKYYEPLLEQHLEKKLSYSFQLISKNIEKGIKEGLYRDDLNVALVANLYVRNLMDMHKKDFCFIENITFEEVFEVMFENHIRAISSPAGIAYFEKRKSEMTQLNKNINNL